MQAHSKLQQALKNDFAVYYATSVAEAKRCLETALPDVIISEVAFEGQESGLDLCRYIRNAQRLRHIPVMFLTSLATLQDKIAGFEAGTDDYVVKPFDPRHLLARIRLLSRIKRLERSEENR